LSGLKCWVPLRQTKRANKKALFLNQRGSHTPHSGRNEEHSARIVLSETETRNFQPTSATMEEDHPVDWA
jgi:hypothetical protein